MKTKNMNFGILASLAFGMLSILNTGAAHADPITLGTPAYGGSGCPAGTASAVLSPDSTQLSVLFDQFVVDAGGSSGKSFDRKACNLAIPVHVPHGMTVGLISIDYRGYNAIPAGGRTTFNVEYFFAGSHGPSYAKTFTGPQSTDYTITNNLVTQSIVWSPCGADVILRTNANISAFTNSLNQQVESTVDSADVSSGIIYQLQWRTCNS